MRPLNSEQTRQVHQVAEYRCGGNVTFVGTTTMIVVCEPSFSNIMVILELIPRAKGDGHDKTPCRPNRTHAWCQLYGPTLEHMLDDTNSFTVAVAVDTAQ